MEPLLCRSECSTIGAAGYALVSQAIKGLPMTHDVVHSRNIWGTLSWRFLLPSQGSIHPKFGPLKTKSIEASNSGEILCGVDGRNVFLVWYVKVHECLFRNDKNTLVG